MNDMIHTMTAQQIIRKAYGDTHGVEYGAINPDMAYSIESDNSVRIAHKSGERNEKLERSCADRYKANLHVYGLKLRYYGM